MFLSPSQASFHEGVYVVDCIWEFFVLVGCRARGNRQDIRLGLDVAMVWFCHVCSFNADYNIAEYVQEVISGSAVPTNGARSYPSVTAAVRFAT